MSLDMQAVEQSYARWARVYDTTFGAITNAGRRRAVELATAFGGEVLEVGVGTGLALPHYGAGVRVTGIDYSADMLAKARARVIDLGMSGIVDLRRMDAQAMEFPDAAFDTVVAMHILSVVPDPARVVAGIARVLKPGGRAVIVNHFASDTGPLAWAERRMAAFDRLLAWKTVFPRDCLAAAPQLVAEREERFPPFGLMTMVVMRKTAVGGV